MDPIEAVSDDGLLTPDVGEWGEEKYRLVRCYEQIFARSMKYEWECRVCIDLYSGTGRARLRDSKRIVEASPLQALRISDPFDRYIFCELDDAKTDALEKRVARDYTARDVKFVRGDSNESVAKVLSYVPQHTREFRVLSFCFADPFNVANLKFNTISRLAAGERKIDFLILIPSGMDAQRNWERESGSYGEFLGNSNWRDEWERQRISGRTFANFFVDEFGKSMARIGYRWHGVASTEVIKNEKHSPMYHLAFFSRHELGAHFWDICRQSTAVQTRMF